MMLPLLGEGLLRELADLSLKSFTEELNYSISLSFHKINETQNSEFDYVQEIR